MNDYTTIPDAEAVMLSAMPAANGTALEPLPATEAFDLDLAPTLLCGDGKPMVVDAGPWEWTIGFGVALEQRCTMVMRREGPGDAVWLLRATATIDADTGEAHCLLVVERTTQAQLDAGTRGDRWAADDSILRACERDTVQADADEARLDTTSTYEAL